MRTTQVRTISGYAGGTRGDCKVLLEITGQSDTVEQVRELVETALRERDALLAVAEASKDFVSRITGPEGSDQQWERLESALAKLREVQS